jgi:hypothetical protein
MIIMRYSATGNEWATIARGKAHVRKLLYSRGKPIRSNNTGCFKKSFKTLKAYINLFRGHVQCFELSYRSKTPRVSPGIVTVQYD